MTRSNSLENLPKYKSRAFLEVKAETQEFSGMIENGLSNRERE